MICNAQRSVRAWGQHGAGHDEMIWWGCTSAFVLINHGWQVSSLARQLRSAEAAEGWQGRRAPMQGRRRGRERGAVEVVGPRGAVADADARGRPLAGGAADRAGRGARSRGAGAPSSYWRVSRSERPTSQGAAGVDPAAAGACRSRHPLAMVEPANPAATRFTQPTAWISLVAAGDCAPFSIPHMEPMHRCPPGDLG